jgi:23S rRNA pseudouridine1911/1915/1917 synthase
VDGRRERDPAAAIRAGARIEVVLKERGVAPEAPAPLEAHRVLHVDDLVVAVDKPAGVLAQEGRAGGRALPDLVAALLGGPALLVHRLDRGTTGVTLLARTRAAQAALLAEFREGRVEKEYRALVAVAPRADEGEIDAPLADDPRTPGKRRIDARGEPARTRWRVLERFTAAGGAALLAAMPETGRTHQIRVHLASIGHPLVGDARYAGPKALTRADGSRLDAHRPLLHALRLKIRHPAGHTLETAAPEPSDIAAACAFLR